MALPWLIGGAVAAVATAILLDDDDNSSSSSSYDNEEAERRRARRERERRERQEKKQRIVYNFKEHLESEGRSIQTAFSNVINFSYTPRKNNEIESFINSDFNGVQQQLFNAGASLSKAKFSDCHVSDKFINAVAIYERLYDVEVTPNPKVVQAFESQQELKNEIQNLNELISNLESV